MFAYCRNNPIYLIDSEGHLPLVNLMTSDGGDGSYNPKPEQTISAGETVQTGEVSYYGFVYEFIVTTVDSVPKGAKTFTGGDPATIAGNIRPAGTYEVTLYNTRLDTREEEAAYGYMGGYLCRVEIITIEREYPPSGKNQVSSESFIIAFIESVITSLDNYSPSSPHWTYNGCGGGGYGGGGGPWYSVLHPVMY